jgi:hypothetical protein
MTAEVPDFSCSPGSNDMRHINQPTPEATND